MKYISFGGMLGIQVHVIACIMWALTDFWTGLALGATFGLVVCANVLMARRPCVARAVLAIVSLAFGISLTGTAEAQSVTLQNGEKVEIFYPEYHAIVTDRGVPYTAPDFRGRNHYWVRLWNTPGAYRTGKDSKFEWDGIAYDGHFMYDTKTSEGGKRVHFRADSGGEKDKFGRPVERFFFDYTVSKDPRFSNWWMAFATDDAKTVWNAVERAAITKSHPNVTHAIIEHMVASGVVEKDFTRMTVDDIRWTLIRYTNIALAHSLRETRRTIGDDVLTQAKVKSLRKGDVIDSYDFYRFGPYPQVANRYEVTEVKKDAVVLTRGGNRTMELPASEVSGWKFAALRRK